MPRKLKQFGRGVTQKRYQDLFDDEDYDERVQLDELYEDRHEDPFEAEEDLPTQEDEYED